jgi:hypothetical protein
MENPTNTANTAGTAPEPKPLAPEVARACEIAATDGEPDGDLLLVAGACKRAREHWYRLVWRNGAWQECTRGSFTSDIRSYHVIYGCVRPGEVLAQHNAGGPVNAIWLVIAPGEHPFAPCTFARTGDRTLRITLPDGRQIERPDPLRSPTSVRREEDPPMDKETLTIPLTLCRPVRIHTDAWPLIATATYHDHDGKIRAQANRTWTITLCVRQHADGRAVVYGTYDYETAWQHERSLAARAGELVPPEADLPAAIRRVAEQLSARVPDAAMHRHIGATADACIADLPPDEL